MVVRYTDLVGLRNMPRAKRKTKMEILEAIKEFLDERGSKPFYKSDLREKGIDPKTAEDFFKIIRFCQKQLPRIKITEMRGNFVVQATTALDLVSEYRESMQAPELEEKQIPTPIGSKTKKKKR
ncbi:MAG: hypothetical protein EAX81_07400 [Candidatus Thorarchaeota archaeon]|nr:hypothetical protein [Candidatus Thorarchaeota archaeon]